MASEPMSEERLAELEEGFRRCELTARFRPGGKPLGDTAVVGECLREIRRLRARVDELLAANTAEVERRRKADTLLRQVAAIEGSKREWEDPVCGRCGKRHAKYTGIDTDYFC